MFLYASLQLTAQRKFTIYLQLLKENLVFEFKGSLCFSFVLSASCYFTDPD